MNFIDNLVRHTSTWGGALASARIAMPPFLIAKGVGTLANIVMMGGSGSAVKGPGIGVVTVGSIIKLNESNNMVDFYVAKHDYEIELNGPGRTLVVRKDVYDQRAWNGSNINAWASCTMRSWLDITYKALLDSDIQEAMGTTTYRYTPGNGNNTLTARSNAVFLLSLTELGESYTYANVEGSALPIASTLQIAYQGGNATIQWTRSPYTGDTRNAWWLDSGGTINFGLCSGTGGSRPAFTLPSTFDHFELAS